MSDYIRDHDKGDETPFRLTFPPYCQTCGEYVGTSNTAIRMAVDVQCPLCGGVAFRLEPTKGGIVVGAPETREAPPPPPRPSSLIEAWRVSVDQAKCWGCMDNYIANGYHVASIIQQYDLQVARADRLLAAGRALYAALEPLERVEGEPVPGCTCTGCLSTEALKGWREVTGE